MATSELSQELLKRADAIGVWANGAIDKIGDGVGKISQIAYDQAIDIATQYITFGRVYLTFLVILGVIFIGLSIWSFISMMNEKYESIMLLKFMGGIISGIIGFMTLVTNVKGMILCWTAPKIWIMIEIAQLVKTMKGN